MISERGRFSSVFNPFASCPNPSQLINTDRPKPTKSSPVCCHKHRRQIELQNESIVCENDIEVRSIRVHNDWQCVLFVPDTV